MFRLGSPFDSLPLRRLLFFDRRFSFLSSAFVLLSGVVLLFPPCSFWFLWFGCSKPSSCSSEFDLSTCAFFLFIIFLKVLTDIPTIIFVFSRLFLLLISNLKCFKSILVSSHSSNFDISISFWSSLWNRSFICLLCSCSTYFEITTNFDITKST